MSVLKNTRHELFAQGIAKGLSADDAYAKAGYKPDRGHASRLAAKGNIVTRVNELKQRVSDIAVIDEARIVMEAARLALLDPRKAFDPVTGDLLPVHEWPDEIAAAVSSIEIDDKQEGHGKDALVYRVKKIKFWDKNSAVEKLMKHLGSFERDNAQRAGALSNLPRDVLKQIEEHLRATVAGATTGVAERPHSGSATRITH